jgi:tetratricopeptide (TPR) repeat protein
MNRTQIFALTVIVILSLTGCATPQQKADRAYKQKNYKLAVDHYKKLFERRDIKDPSVYRKAAKAALKEGSLTLAERYYSKALRFGAGPKVAKELAKFYVQTSNYASAIRIFQYLLETDIDKQPIYNNLGTALMYAEKPLAAETYMLIAQEMSPEDPVPYLNLGLLYDEHLNQKRTAIEFYRCYLQLGNEQKQLRKVRSRVQQLRNSYSHHGDIRLECGQPYRAKLAESPEPRNEELKKLKERIEEASKRQAGGTKTEDRTITLTFDGSESKKPSSMPTIESRLSDQPKAKQPQRTSAKANTTDQNNNNEKAGGQKTQTESETATTADDTSSTDSSEGEELFARAKKAFDGEQFQKVVRVLSNAPLQSLGYREKRLYGEAQKRLGNTKDAIRWLEWSIEEKMTLNALRPLVKLYSDRGLDSKLEEICDRVDEYNSALREDLACP